MKNPIRILLTTLALGALLACQAPNSTEDTSSDSGSNNSSGASVNVGADVSLGGSSDIFADLTVSASGTTYKYGEVKSYYQCVAEKSPNVASKTVAEGYVKDMNEAESSKDEKAAKEIYTKAATGIKVNQTIDGTDCQPQ